MRGEYGESRAGNRRRREGVMLLSLDHKDQCRIHGRGGYSSSKEFVDEAEVRSFWSNEVEQMCRLQKGSHSSGGELDGICRYGTWAWFSMPL